jgi:hypothetical protein
MTDAIMELAARSKDHRELRRFREFHQAHPEVLDFLVAEIRLRIERVGGAFSFHSLWDYCRWKIELEQRPTDTYKMNDHAAPFYARAIVILHPDLNGKCEFRKCRTDEILGTDIAPMTANRPGDYSRRLCWADGTALEDGWRPSHPHVIQHAPRRRPDIH